MINSISRFVTRFFLWLSVTDPDFILQCPKREKTIQALKGQIVFLVAIFATLSASYAIFTVTKSVLISLSLGFFWGWLIMSIDRLLVSPYKKTLYANLDERTMHNTLKPFVLRAPIAFLLGILISIPIVLSIFQIEIEISWKSKRLEESTRDKESAYNQIISQLKLEDENLRNQFESMPPPQEEEKLFSNIDSSGRKKYDKIKTIVDPNQKLKETIINRRLKIQDELEKQRTDSYNFKKIEKEKIESELSISFGERYEILQNLINDEKHKPLKKIYFWIQLFIILTELLPVLMKILSDAGMYDYLLEKHYDDNK